MENRNAKIIRTGVSPIIRSLLRRLYMEHIEKILTDGFSKVLLLCGQLITTANSSLYPITITTTALF
jgi:hypothetical protein